MQCVTIEAITSTSARVAEKTSCVGDLVHGRKRHTVHQSRREVSFRYGRCGTKQQDRHRRSTGVGNILGPRPP
jgi:hypothetical protein